MEKQPEITEDELRQKIVNACNAYVDSIESGEPVMILDEGKDRWYSALDLKKYLAELETQLTSAQDDFDTSYDKFCEGEISEGEFIEHRDAWREKKALLEPEIRTATIMENRVSVADTARRDMKGRLPKMTGFDPERVKSMVDKVLLNPDGTLKVVFEERTGMLAETRVMSMDG